MNGALLLALSGVVLLVAYFVYGSYLERVWGVDPSRKTPAHTHGDGIDYVPASKAVLFGHQFASIAGAGPINGPIIAAMFGWAPVLVWILVGCVFFGAVQDFAALYASVRNEGKTVSVLIEKYVGKTGKVLFLLFVWLFCILVIAAFADIVAATFNGFTGVEATSIAGAATASTSLLFIVFAIGLGLLFKAKQLSQSVQSLIAIVILVVALFIGLQFPVFAERTTWLLFVYAYIFVASVLPVWLLLQPRDFLNSFLLLIMLAAALVGVLVAQPTVNLPAFAGFNVKGLPLFPILFVTVACGAISGFHALVSSGTSSKQVSNEKDMKLIGFGGMLLEGFLAVIALIAVGALATADGMPAGSPPVIFANALSQFLAKVGLPTDIVYTLITLAISAFALTSLDSVTRVARLTLQELVSDATGALAIFKNMYVATVVTLVLAGMLAIGGYAAIWPLFGSGNQLLAALALIAISVFLKRTGKKNFMLTIPIVVMLSVTVTSLCILIYKNIMVLSADMSKISTNGLQLVFGVILLALGLVVAYQSFVKSRGDEVVEG